MGGEATPGSRRRAVSAGRELGGKGFRSDYQLGGIRSKLEQGSIRTSIDS
ncbi:MAG: hypothetical protein ACI841_002272 [Planctomycetota bacterium]|jgi:hypothetical protein